MLRLLQIVARDALHAGVVLCMHREFPALRRRLLSMTSPVMEITRRIPAPIEDMLPISSSIHIIELNRQHTIHN